MTLDQFLDYLLPVVILLVFTVLGYVIKFALNRYLVAFAKKTKTKIDDIVIGAIKTPLIAAFALIGLGIALRYATFLPGWVATHTPTIFEVLIALVAIYSVVKVLSGLINYYGIVRPSMKTITPTIDKIAKVLVALIGFLIILNTLGVSVTAPLAALGIGGIAIAFALQSTLSDFLSGIYMMADRPIRDGDYIKLETGQEGYVIDIGWRSSRIRELSNNVIVVPNSKLANTIVTNYQLPEPELSVLVQVGVSYDSDLEKVEKVTIDVAKKVLKKVSGGVETFEPFIRYHTFSDFSINFTVILRGKEYVDKYLLTHEFIKALHKRYRKEGIEIPFPIRTVYMERK
jgi:small-conductance mechanosensitive channel